MLVNNGAVEWLWRVSALFSYRPSKGILSGFQSLANTFCLSRRILGAIV